MWRCGEAERGGARRGAGRGKVGRMTSGGRNGECGYIEGFNYSIYGAQDITRVCVKRGFEDCRRDSRVRAVGWVTLRLDVRGCEGR